MEINEGHYLELLDRLHVMCCVINDHILDHPVTNTDIRIKQLVIKSLEELSDAYQIVGEIGIIPSNQ